MSSEELVCADLFCDAKPSQLDEANGKAVQFAMTRDLTGHSNTIEALYL